MIDPQILRDNPGVIKASQKARGASESIVDDAVAAEALKRQALTKYEELRAGQNAFGKQVSSAPKEQKPALVAKAKDLASEVKAAELAANAAEADYNRLMGQLENIIIDGVPSGGEDDFVVLREVGTKPEFDFEPKDHVELGESLQLFDLGRGSKVSGARFYFLSGWGARLELALMNMALDKALANGFTPLITPTLVKPEVMAGTGFLGKHSDEIYYLPADDLYLVGTSEVALAGFHSDEIIDLGPEHVLRYAGWSTCYRREAGSYGKDTRGILRVHQFNKLEMFSYCLPENAEAEHLKLVGWQEEMLQACELSYRVIDTAAGDLGASAARKYDCEAWVPTQGSYRELTSTSNCTTYQARRLGTRYRNPETGKTQPVATLNGTLATTRWIVALLETHQQADGSIRIPVALRPYLAGTEFIR